MSDWLTTTDIANLAGLKIDTIYTYRKRDTLPKEDHMLGNKPLWKKETIQKWINSRSTEVEITDVLS
jgi:predicted DNA-binding transcriptional regulator AlpA